MQAPREGYSLFMSLGNDKLPTFAGLGHVSMYMCQFPFDLGRPTRPGTVKALASYDYVLLNSEFTDGWVLLYWALRQPGSRRFRVEGAQQRVH